MFGSLGAPELLIIGGVIILIFGVGKISGLGRELGSSIKEFRRAVKDEDAEAAKQSQLQQSTPQHVAPPPAAPPQAQAQAPQQPPAQQGATKTRPEFLAAMYSFGILVAFVAAQLAVIRLRMKEPGLAREIRARSTRKYGWGDGLIVELASAPRPHRD